MINTEEYYTPPSQAVFDDIKQASIKVWQTYDDTYHYASEKIDRIKDLTNVSDNYAYMVAMFDIHNQQKVLANLETAEAKELVERLIS